MKDHNMRRKTRRHLILLVGVLLCIYIMWAKLVKPRGHDIPAVTIEMPREDPLPKMPVDDQPAGIDDHKLKGMPGAKQMQKTEPSNEVNDAKSDDEDWEENILKTTSVFLSYIPSTQADGIQNILLRKAITAKLKIALPQPNRQSLCFPKEFTDKCPMNNDDTPYDMITHQIRFNKKAVSSSLKDDTKYIALIRHPIAHLQAAYYDNDWSDYVGNKPFGSYIETEYNRFADTYDFDKHLPYRNIQLFCLGLQSAYHSNRNAVIQKVDNLKAEFNLILIQEYMLESLVLLKQEIGWQDEELALFGIQSRPENYGLDELTKRVNDTIILHNEGDMRMYEMLLKNFEQRIKEFGEKKMKKKKAKLQDVINKEMERCLRKTEAGMFESSRRTEHRLSWDGESDRYCHYHISAGSELTGLMRLEWERREEARKKREKDEINEMRKGQQQQQPQY